MSAARRTQSLKRIVPLTDFDLDMVMACRYAYYVLTKSILTDYDYDTLEKDYTMVNGPLPVGSSKKEDYTDGQRALALYFLLSGRFTDSETIKPKNGEELL